MSADVLDRVETTPPTPPPSPPRAARLAAWLRHHRASLAWFTPVFLLGGVVQAVNMGGIPQRFDDEGTYVAQAFAATELGSLTHYTYIYDHPPLGWLQMGTWFELTGALSRYPNDAVLAGREFMLLATLVSAGLLWLLARRLHFTRAASAAAVALFALSPLAVQFHRSVYLDNIATPWLLAAFLLALAPHRQLLAFAASGATFAVAVLTKETYLLFLPFLVWQVWRTADRSIRRYSLSVAAAVFVLVSSGYLLLAAVKGELVPGSGRSSLWNGVYFQLFGRTSSGSLFDPGSLSRTAFDQWWALDPVFIAAAPVAALVALRDRRLWPLAAAFLLLVAFLLRPGYLPVPYVIALIPVAALLVAGAVQVCVRAARARRGALRRRAGLGITAVATVAVVAVAAPLWTVQLRGLLQADLDQPMTDATAWIEQNVPDGARLVVDDAMWVDLVRDGRDPKDVVWYYKVDTDPAVAAEAPDGWPDYGWVVTTRSLRTFPTGFPVVERAIANSTTVASFGTGDQQVQVLRVEPAGAAATAQARRAAAAARVAAGAQLVRNPGLGFDPATAALVSGGRVDDRAMAVLSAAAGSLGVLTVADAPLVPGEDDAQLPRRQLVVSALDGRSLAGDPAAARRVKQFFTARSGVFTPASVEPVSDGLRITWSLNTGSVLPAAAP